MNCCNNKHTSDISGKQWTNIICLSCGSHYAGQPGYERHFTKKEWELYVETGVFPGELTA